jgi:hypothetical protein
MKKYIAMAAAAAALAVAGAASAQAPGTYAGAILGELPTQAPSPGTIVIDAQTGQRGVLVPNVVGYDAFGRPLYDGASVYGTGRVYAWGNRNDRDGDGVPTRRDRFPDDPRYR